MNDESLIQWQNDNGFHSDGVDRQGNLLAPGYPIFSRLAWTHVDPVYLHGNQLAALRDEANRIAKSANNPSLETQLNELVTLAAKAQGDGSGLRFFA